MGHSGYQQWWAFNFEGQFLEFGGYKAGKPKYLHLRFQAENVPIKLPKELRTSLRLILQPGDPIRVSGIGKLDRHTGELKLKAYQVNPLAFNTTQPPQLTAASTAASSPLPVPESTLPSVAVEFTQPKVKILVCQKSGCMKRGGRTLLQSLEAALRERNLQNQVIIERTGCLKRCSSAPNCLIMPGKRYFSQVQPEAIAAFVEECNQKRVAPL